MNVPEQLGVILTEITEIKIFMAEQSIYSKDKEKRLTKVEKDIEVIKNKQNGFFAGIIAALGTGIGSYFR